MIYNKLILKNEWKGFITFRKCDVSEYKRNNFYRNLESKFKSLSQELIYSTTVLLFY